MAELRLDNQMTFAPLAMKPKRSVCGPAAIGLPALGVALEALWFCVHPQTDHIPKAIELCALWMFLSGIAFSVIGMVREERLRWLPALGFILNSLLISVHFVV
jgi:uncharacterized membrane protein YidH (DUF202 family)